MCLLTVCACGSIAVAETLPTQIQGTPLSAAPNYMKLDAPKQLAYNSDYLVVLDDGYIKIKTNTSEIRTTEVTFTISEMHIVGNYLLALVDSESDNARVVAFDLTNGAQLGDDTTSVLNIGDDSGSAYPFSMTYNSASSTLYALYYDGGIYSYSVSTSSTLSITAPTDNLLIRRRPTGMSGLYKLTFKQSSVGGDIFVLAYSGNVYNIMRYSIADAAMSEWTTSAVAHTFGNVYFTSNDLHLYLCSTTSDGTSIELFDTTDKSSTLVQSLSADGFAASGEIVLLSNTAKANVRKYAFVKESSSFELLAEYAYKGDSDTLLNTPLSVATHGDKVYVADSVNKRVVCQTYSNGKLTTSGTIAMQLAGDTTPTPILVTATDTTLFVADSAKRVISYDVSTLQQLEVIDLAFLPSSIVSVNEDKLYISSGTAVFVYQEGELKELYTNMLGISAIAVSGHGNSVFVGTSSNILLFDSNGKQSDYMISLPENSTLLSMTSDYSGNLYCVLNLNDNTVLRQYRRELNGLTSMGESTLDYISQLTATNNAFVADGKLAFTCQSEHLLVLFDISGGISPNLSQELTAVPEIALLSPSTVLRINTAFCVFPSYDNYENYIELPAGQFATVLFDYTGGGIDWHYVRVNGIQGFITASTGEAVTSIAPAYTRASILYKSVGIYAIPEENPDYLLTSITDIAAEITILESIGYIDEDTQMGFYRVSFGGITGYLAAKKVVEYYNPSTELSPTVYMKIDSKKLGEQVAIYKDTSPVEVILTVSDGSKVMLLGEYNVDAQYTQVSYNGTEGYVETKYLLEKGLTENQSSGLLLAAIVLGGALLLFAALKRMK